MDQNKSMRIIRAVSCHKFLLSNIVIVSNDWDRSINIEFDLVKDQKLNGNLRLVNRAHGADHGNPKVLYEV